MLSYKAAKIVIDFEFDIAFSIRKALSNEEIYFYPMGEGEELKAELALLEEKIAREGAGDEEDVGGGVNPLYPDVS